MEEKVSKDVKTIIDNQEKGWKYLLIVEAIVQSIGEGKLKDGDKLPSIRTLAEYYQCNKGTIIKALETLEQNHQCYSIPKSGFYVIAGKEEGTQEGSCYDFAQVAPLDEYIPYREFSHSMNKAIEKYAKTLFRYGQAEGLESTRFALEKYLASQQVFCHKEQIVITSGALQGLDLLFRAMAPGTKVLIEQPTYNLIHQIAQNNGVELLGISRGEGGIDFTALECQLKRCQFFYTIPRLSNPLGVSYSEAQKKRLIHMAKKNNVWLIEDDYLGDLIGAGKNMPLHYYGMGEQVIYVKSFSKGFLPGIRLGCVVFPTDQVQLRESFIQLKRLTDYGTSMYNQGALEIFIESGMYHRHLLKIQDAYRERMNRLRRFLDKKIPENIRCYIPETGIFISLWVKSDRNKKRVLQRLSSHNIQVVDEDNFSQLSDWLGANNLEKTLYFRLCVSTMSLEKNYEGLCEIFRLLGEKSPLRDD